MNVLVLNSGSSSLKFQVIATDLERIKQHQDDRIFRGEIEGIGGEAIIHVQLRSEPGRTFTAPLYDVSAALDYLVRYIALDRSAVSEIKSIADVHAVGHRVVHGAKSIVSMAVLNSTLSANVI
jgi:acetate kinase